jgi:hypothetical protein
MARREDTGSASATKDADNSLAREIFCANCSEEMLGLFRHGDCRPRTGESPCQSRSLWR